MKPDTFEDTNSTWLNLVDGSTNFENVPLGSLFVKARALDVIVAVDGSADEVDFGWPKSVPWILSTYCVFIFVFQWDIADFQFSAYDEPSAIVPSSFPPNSFIPIRVLVNRSQFKSDVFRV